MQDPVVDAENNTVFAAMHEVRQRLIDVVGAGGPRDVVQVACGPDGKAWSVGLCEREIRLLVFAVTGYLKSL